jgi:hypothetical protein
MAVRQVKKLVHDRRFGQPIRTARHGEGVEQPARRIGIDRDPLLDDERPDAVLELQLIGERRQVFPAPVDTQARPSSLIRKS